MSQLPEYERQQAEKAARAAKTREQFWMLVVLFGDAALLIFVAYLVSLNPNRPFSKLFIYGCVGALLTLPFLKNIVWLIGRIQKHPRWLMWLLGLAIFGALLILAASFISR